MVCFLLSIGADDDQESGNEKEKDNKFIHGITTNLLNIFLIGILFTGYFMLNHC
jgi:hypothetical protein